MALRLLRSKSKDSTAQLKAMLDEAIRQRKGQLGPGPRSPGLTKQHSRSVSSDRTLDRDKLEKEKRKELDRLKKDLSELADRPSEPSKRPRLDSPGLSSASHTPSPTPEQNTPDLSDAAASEAGDFAELEMNLEDQFDCSCCVCKTFTQESGNKLMECNTCQNLYHQDCHSPAVSNQEASDPRLIWNCQHCSRPDKSGGSSGASSSSGAGGGELSSSARKRLKLIKKQ